MSLVVFEHVDFLSKLAIALFALILFDALVQLHVVPEGVFGLHACQRRERSQSTCQPRSPCGAREQHRRGTGIPGTQECPMSDLEL